MHLAKKKQIVITLLIFHFASKFIDSDSDDGILGFSFILIPGLISLIWI